MKTVLFASLLATTVAAIGTQTQTPPAFRSRVDLVAVDFIAVTGDGQPVGDLRPAEVKLTVDGRVHEIHDLQFVRVAHEEPGSGSVSRASPVPPPFATNRAADAGRTVILLFDDNSLRPGNERAALRAAETFLDRLATRDRVALATASQTIVDLTTDHARVRAGLGRIVGHGPAGTTPEATTRPTGTAIPRAGPAMVWLRDFLQGLKDIDGPKTVILVADGAPPTAPKGGVPDPSVAEDYKQIAKAAGAVRAQLYVIHPYNFALDASQNSGDVGRTSTSTVGYQTGEADKLQGLEALAAVTGGEMFQLSSSAGSVFEHVLRQSSAYYLLGFEPDASERNGKSHGIHISVARPGVIVRARPEFTIARPAATEPPVSTTLPQMLKQTRAYPDVPLRAAAFTAHAGTKGHVNIVVVAESIDPATALADVAFGLINTDTHRMELAWPGPELRKSDTRIISGAAVPPGPYKLRVAVASRDGRRGTVEYEFVAGLATMGSLEFGDLMIGQGQPDGSFEPQLEVGDRAAATGYVELHGTLPVGTTLSATFELASTADGAAIASVPGIIARTGAGGFSARGAVPIGSVAAAEYVVRAIIRIEGAVAGRVVRAIRKM